MLKVDKPFTVVQVVVTGILILIMCFMTFFRFVVVRTNAGSDAQSGTGPRFTTPITDKSPRETSRYSIIIAAKELENAFNSADAVIYNNRLYYNPEDSEPFYVFKAAEKGKRALYSRFSPSLKLAKKAWSPKVDAPGLLMTSPFRYFTVFNDSIKYQDYDFYSTVPFQGAVEVYVGNSNVPKIEYYGQMLAEKDTFTLDELAPVIWLMRTNFLVGYKDHISWFKIPGPDGCFTVQKYVPGEGLVDVYTDSGSDGKVVAAVIENKLLLFYNPERDFRLNLVDLMRGDGEHSYTWYNADSLDEKPLSAWTYLVHDGNLYLCFTTAGKLYALTLTETDVTRSSSLYNISTDSYTVKDPDSVMVYYTPDGERRIAITQNEHITTMNWSD